ncbi:MAG: hypothetical protein [Circular genetic element sp.]|nr:MAG: hypothetical protein [Circular genetic element sp.]
MSAPEERNALTLSGYHRLIPRWRGFMGLSAHPCARRRALKSVASIECHDSDFAAMVFSPIKQTAMILPSFSTKKPRPSAKKVRRLMDQPSPNRPGIA